MWLLQLPPKLSSPFINGFTPLSLSLSTKPSSIPTPNPPSFLPPIKAMKSLQGKVVCATNDKTVAVEVVRLAPHPKYKRRVRKKKKYQAHDPDNQFKVGDLVLLQKSRPISKTKTFVALAAPDRGSKNVLEKGDLNGEISIPFESQKEP
ncbi:hypothetical protein TanjilG_04400 [Lupinus angustifolius]|uniref:Small ribosomal subunit protein uS17c n=2 Tax=Lupinus angustifolius TaxID=3871 RepID=A0A4P1RQ31_LUPAN|nr:PREDICTED: 30S ribosomal protein S17, chloroplastic [Lupinus angustifolius]OIW15865.1 hypothetical protein TanjilG_04400 [Lupinus angustifolius]